VSPANITPQQFKDLATELFGNEWIEQLCLRLDVQRRTPLRWASGERPIPAAVEELLLFLRNGRRNAL
jgi:hypothetical protein